MAQIPAPTQDFNAFVLNHPNLANRAREYDEMARKELKDKYTAFAQGTHAVIGHRTSQNPVANVRPGPIEPQSAGTGRPKYRCSVCNNNQEHIHTHLQIHNQHPGKNVYCPVATCLKRMPRNDTCTLPEHVLSQHPKIIFGPHPHPLKNSERILQLSKTQDIRVLGRLNTTILRRFIAKSQEDLSNLLPMLLVVSVQELDEQHGMQTPSAVNVAALLNVQNEICDRASWEDNGMVDSMHVEGLSRIMALNYLEALRLCLHDLDVNLNYQV